MSNTETASHNREFTFITRREANAFKAGIELVNDSSIRVHSIVRRGDRNHGRYIVLVQDDDHGE